MKIIKTITILLLINVVIFSCSDDKKRDANFLPPLKIEIADEIKSDAELVEVIKSSEKAINEFSDNIEQLAIDGKDFLSKKDEEQNLMDGIKAGKMMLEFVSNSTQMVASMEKFQTYVEGKKGQGIINDEQLKSLEQVGKSFEKRIDQINEKYKNYFDE